ncbi:amino acid transporter heavy chain SLC3A1-like [Ciona intestinalis]
MADNNAYENDNGKQSTSFTNEEDNGDYEKFNDTGFTNIKLDDEIVDIPKPYAGMPKDVLLHYSRQRHFVWARNIMTAAVILAILVLLSLVIALIAISPGCQPFWQTSPIYQIYPKSYADDNNDGVGDIAGIRSKLDYLKDDLGVNMIWLNPMYLSPQVDNGYDVMDYVTIDPMFGTMAEMELLITDIHDRGMKIIMDFVPNHTSDKHAWFNASSDPSHAQYEKYKDYYIWVDSTNGGSTGVPNNWQSVFSDTDPSAWEWNDKRKQFYYHAFYKEQPDLNLRNEAVLVELDAVLTYWMDQGADGFRCDAVGFMLEATHLRDNPLVDGTKPPSYTNVYPDYTQNQMGVHEIIARWRHVLDKFSTEPGVYRFMETEVYDDIDTVIRYYGTPYVDEADFPMNFKLIDLQNPTSWTGSTIESTVLQWMRKMPSSKWPNWVIGNHDNSRVTTRLGNKLASCAAFLTMTLSGTPGMYYGEEIGMEDLVMTNPVDTRDPERTPMQWDTTNNAGFCDNCTSWLPVNNNYLSKGINVEEQKTNATSMFNLYKQLINLRSDETFRQGYLCVLMSTAKTIVYVRELPGAKSFLVVINFGDTSETINLQSSFPFLPGVGTLYLSTSNQIGGAVYFNNLLVDAQEGMAVQFKPGGNLFNKQAGMLDRCFTSKKVCVNGIGLMQFC